MWHVSRNSAGTRDVGHHKLTNVANVSRPALGGLLSSSYRQHQESLAAERQRRRVEREERLQRIEREERNKHRWELCFFFFFLRKLILKTCKNNAHMMKN